MLAGICFAKRFLNRQWRIRNPQSAIRNLHTHGDLARFGEFDGVARQIDEYLSQPRRIAEERVGYCVVDGADQLQVLFVRANGHRPHGAAENFAEGKRRGIDFELAGLDL